VSPYIQSLRLRTLPLSVSGIILGSGLAWKTVGLDSSDVRFWIVFALAICTTLSLQILSNLCNELGDAQKGTDTDQKGRAAYGLQAGTITEKEIRTMIGWFIALCVIFGLALIYFAFWFQTVSTSDGGTIDGMGTNVQILQTLTFILLGGLAIVGAIKYTLGKHSYGYIGLGDLGVFLFFGLLSTVGAYYLQIQTITEEIVWMGAAIGLPCVGVLNLNNVRDMENDRKHGKKTFASLLGQRGGRMYHTYLLVGCLAIMATFGHWWTLCIIPVWGWHLWYVWTHTEKLDKQMPVLMFSTLIVSILALI